VWDRLIASKPGKKINKEPNLVLSTRDSEPHRVFCTPSLGIGSALNSMKQKVRIAKTDTGCLNPIKPGLFLSALCVSTFCEGNWRSKQNFKISQAV
jgi:hypothetical protein